MRLFSPLVGWLNAWRLTLPSRSRLFAPLSLVSSLLFTLVLPVVISLVLSGGFSSLSAQTGQFNYGEALQKSIWFYDAQRSGVMPPNNRVNWRGNAGTHDGSDVGLDLTGGFHDAGDNVKFGLPMAYTTTMLSWGVIEYQQAYANAGQLDAIRSNIRWATDYLLRAHAAPNVLYGQVGSGSLDHSFWGPAEVMQMARPSFAISATCPGSDLAGETAAALAAASIVFKSADPAYSATLLQHAKDLYTFADTFRGKYSDCITAAQGFYTSFSGFNDELVWGAAWLFRATADTAYLSKAQAGYANLSNQGQQSSIKSYKWTLGWDDKSFGSYLLLAKLTGQTQYMQDTQRWLNWWSVGGTDFGADGTKITYSPGGEAWLDVWGSLRYASTTAFAALVYSDFVTDPILKQRYHDFAVGQVNYILGNNPLKRSFMVGFGANPPRNIHHRTAHSSWDDNIQDPVNNRHIIYGALVGGPSSPNDQWTEDRSNFQMTEPADDYNAGLTGALARLFMEFGGAPLANFPVPEAPTNDELSVQATLNQNGSNFTEVKAFFINQTGWPARETDNLSMRYFFTLDGATTPSQITLTSPFSSCGSGFLSGPFQWSGNVYYVKADCSGTKIFPGGQGNFKKEVQFRLTSAGTWDPTNDYSFTGLLAPGSTAIPVTNITLYDNGVLAWGKEPPTAGNNAPLIASITPTSGLSGSSVTIAGSNFGATPGANTVTFGTANATVTAASATSITATVPNIAPGAVGVSVTVGGVVSNPISFTVSNPISTAPSVTSISPTSGLAGSSVTIAGSNFGATPGANTVSFGSTAATVTGASTTSLTVTVPNIAPGLASVTVTVGGVASNPVNFMVSNPTSTAPTITSISPTSGLTGSSVSINGSNFGATLGLNTVKFGSVTATVVSASATSIIATVPNIAPGVANVTVTFGGVVSNALPFTVTATAGGFHCHVAYTISNQWSTGFQAAISITNTGTTAISSWSLQWTFAGNQQISNLWNATFAQTGAAVTVNSASYNGSIPAGGSYNDMGFTANSSGTNAVPTSFSINGTTCQ